MVAAAGRGWTGQQQEWPPASSQQPHFDPDALPRLRGRGEQPFPEILWLGASLVRKAPALPGPFGHEIQDCPADVGADLFGRLGGINHPAIVETSD